MNNYVPTTEQKAFIKAVLKLVDKGYGMMALNASGGTGKTATINYIRTKTILKDLNIMILAPTHKACSLLGNGANTIHKFFNAEKDVDENGKVQFHFKNAIKNKVDLLIVDESSMVSEQMYDNFKKLSSNIPILFCGDEKQIPPVEEDSSIVFQKIKCRTFTKNMRSRDSLSNHWLQKFREAVDNDKIVRVDKVKKEVIYATFEDNKDAIVLAWTNRQVGYWNNSIRRQLYLKNNEILEKYYPDEKLVFSGYRNTLIDDNVLLLSYFDDLKSKVNFRPLNIIGKNHSYHSSDIIEIKTIAKKEIFIPYHRCKHQEDEKKLKKCEECNIKGHNTLGYNINFYVIKDENDVTWLKAFDEDSDKLANILSDFKNHCKHMKSKNLWKLYYGIKEIIDPDINYIYSSTVHKAQGSQWEIVFVDIDNLRFCRDNSLSSRLQYTAVSRMIKEVLFV